MKSQNRKKWTAKTDVTEDVLKTREKRKWQIALRRYIILQQQSTAYAPYFGLDITHIREWIAQQFEPDMNWTNFSSTWQFDHIVPVAYFDFTQEADLRLCWNFINIRVSRLEEGRIGKDKLDALSSKSYFSLLYARTNYPLCKLMVEKLEALETAQLENTGHLEAFIRENETYLQTISSFSEYEYLQLNEGVGLDQILAERNFQQQFENK